MTTDRGTARFVGRRALGLAVGGMILTGLLLAAALVANQPTTGNADGWRLIGASSTGIAHSDADHDGAPGINPHDFDLTAVVADGTGRTSPFSIYPGVNAALVVTVSNTKNQDMQVNTLTVTPGDASSACPAANLSVGSFSGSLLVPRNGTASLTLPLTMSLHAPDGCKDVSFPLALSGEGAKA